MCGKSNPAELENCQYCQARLKPLANKSGSILPDWLDNLRTKKDQEPASPPPPPEPEVPDWLSRVRERSQEDKDSEAFSQITLPDWLVEDEETPPPADQATPEPAETGIAPEATPAWLSEFTSAEPVEEPKPVDQESDIPDWLKKFSEFGELLPAEQGVDAPPPAVSESSPFTETSLPSDLPVIPNNNLEQPPADQAAEVTELPDWMLGLAPASPPTPGQPSEAPAVSLVEPSAEDEPLASPLSTDLPVSLENNAPEWLKDFQAAGAGQPQTALPFAGEALPPAEINADLPDWLGKLSAPPSAEPAVSPAPEEPAPQEGESLIPAEIPGWVKAMRPIETIVPVPKVDHRIEERGPLAGLKDILPAESGALEIAPPPSFAFRLHTTDQQRGRQALLESLLASEAEPKPREKPAPRLDNQILRWVIAALILLAVIVPVVANVSILPAAEAYPGQAAQALAAIDSLTQNVPVLVSVDYEPGLAGEMEAAAAGVMNDLMARGARLTIVSTSPTGSALAVRLIEKAAGNKPEPFHTPYLNGERVANLGYLPGSASALLGFAQAPQAAAPFTVTGQYAWSLPVLQGIHSLSDFGLVLVITENPDTGRGWVEQVHPALGDRPLILVSSAQAAPVLLPYLDSGQIDGMVTGVTGGAVFEKYSSRPGLGQAYAGGYQAALAVAVCVILVGAIVEAITLFVKSSKAKKEA